MLMCIYRPPKQNNQHLLENLSSIADHYSSIYDNYTFLGDFNMEPKCPALSSFMQSFNLFNLIKTNTCFKGKGSCIDLILTNRKYCFKHSSTFETGLSDHHHLVYSMLKTCFKRKKSKLEECPKHYEIFEKTFVNVLDAHAPRKTTKVIKNPMLIRIFIKPLWSALNLKTKQIELKQIEPRDYIAKYKKQQNLVVKLNRDSKLCYFDNRDIKKFKTFLDWL